MRILFFSILILLCLVSCESYQKQGSVSRSIPAPDPNVQAVIPHLVYGNEFLTVSAGTKIGGITVGGGYYISKRLVTAARLKKEAEWQALLELESSSHER